MNSSTPLSFTNMSCDTESSEETVSELIPPCLDGEECGCDLKTDTVLRSSEGRVFGAHAEYLYQYSGELGRMADPHYLPEGEPVQFAFSGEVLSLLLQLTHPQRPPSLHGVDFNTVAQLADAVEQYRVYSGMEVCRMMMVLNVEEYPALVFAYAAKNGHEALMLDAVPRTVNLPLATVYDALLDRPDLFVAWVRYREGLIRDAQDVYLDPPVVLHRGGVVRCRKWAEFHNRLLKSGLGQPFSLDAFNKDIEQGLGIIKGCWYCTKSVEKWRNSARRVAEEQCSLNAFLLS